MRRLVLVKHSMPEIKRDTPASAWRLSEIGCQRSELLAARLRDFSPEVIWSSRESKAVETAEVVATAFGVPVQIADGLEEHHRSGGPYFPTEAEFEKAVEHFFCKPDQLVLGTETAKQALNRFTPAINEIIDVGQMDNIVVTHGTVMTLYVASFAGVRPMYFWRRLGLPSFVVLALPDMHIQSTVESVT